MFLPDIITYCRTVQSLDVSVTGVSHNIPIRNNRVIPVDTFLMEEKDFLIPVRCTIRLYLPVQHTEYLPT